MKSPFLPTERRRGCSHRDHLRFYRLRESSHPTPGRPELYACDWLEQIGSYLKYRLFDANVLLDVTSTSINRLWNQLAPAIECIRVTRGDSLYENFEYWAAKGRLWARAHPQGAYPKKMPRMRDLKGVGLGAGTIYRPAIFGDTADQRRRLPHRASYG